MSATVMDGLALPAWFMDYGLCRARNGPGLWIMDYATSVMWHNPWITDYAACTRVLAGLCLDYGLWGCGGGPPGGKMDF